MNCAGSYRGSAANPERAFVRALPCRQTRPPCRPSSRPWGLAAVERAAKAVGRRIAMTSPLAQSSLLTPLISSAAMRAILDDRARVQRMLDFEVALARAQARIGIVPALAVERIAQAARADRYDLAALGEAAVPAGNIAIPLIHALTTEVAKTDAAA